MRFKDTGLLAHISYSADDAKLGYKLAKRIPVEENKPEAERGSYLHPDAFGQPEERRIRYALYPELMHRQKEMRARQIEQLRQRVQGMNQ